MKLSIIVAVFNIEDFIGDCLESLVKISLSSDEYEIVVVNDGSTDQSLSVIESYAQMYRQIKIFSQENIGTGSARNTGIVRSTGEYIWIIDGDDFVNPKYVREALEYAINQKADVLAFDFMPVNELGLPENWISFQLKFDDHTHLSGPEFYSLNFENSYIWLYFFKRKLFLDKKLSFHDSIKMQDGELMPHIMSHTNKVVSFDKKLINYRFRYNSAVNNKAIESFNHLYFSMVYVYNSISDFQSRGNINTIIYKAIELKKTQIVKSLYYHFISNDYNGKINTAFISLLKESKIFPFPPHVVLHEHIKYRWVRMIINLHPLLGRFISQHINNLSPLYQLRILLNDSKAGSEIKMPEGVTK